MKFRNILWFHLFPDLSLKGDCIFIFFNYIFQKYIADNGVDPINGKEMTIDQLIEINVSPVVKPKVPSATSIPAVLKSLQDEWDAVMLNSFTLRQQLQTARQELR